MALRIAELRRSRPRVAKDTAKYVTPNATPPISAAIGSMTNKPTMMNSDIVAAVIACITGSRTPLTTAFSLSIEASATLELRVTKSL